MSNKTSIYLKYLAALFLSFSTVATAMSVYKIRIDENFIRASKDTSTVELKLQSDSLVVSQLPNDGFYGLKIGDRILSVNLTQIHKTADFIDALEKANGQDAHVQVMRASTLVSLNLPRQGYSWFL